MPDPSGATGPYEADDGGDPSARTSGGTVALTVTIDLADLGPTPVELPELPQQSTDALLLAHQPWGRNRSGLAALEWLDRRQLVRLAFAFALECPQAGPIAVWPLGVPAQATALALAAGGLLTERHPDAVVARVMCAVRPPARRSRPAIHHEVRVEIGGQIDMLTVWELLVPATGSAGDRLPITSANAA